MSKPSQLRRVSIGIAVLIAVQAIAAGGYLLLRKRAPSSPSATAEELSPMVAPALSFERQDGTRHTLGELRGKVVLVHFWATWCPPCAKELPGLLQLAGELERGGRFALLAISLDDEWGELRAFFAGELPGALARLLGPDDPQRFGVSTLPDSYLVNAEGRLVARYPGARDWHSPAVRAELEGRLRALGASDRAAD